MGTTIGLIAAAAGTVLLLFLLGRWFWKRGNTEGGLAKDAERLADNQKQTEKGSAIAGRARDWLAAMRGKRVRNPRPIVPDQDNPGNGG